jgi:hypothetical protein
MEKAGICISTGESDGVMLVHLPPMAGGFLLSTATLKNGAYGKPIFLFLI